MTSQRNRLAALFLFLSLNAFTFHAGAEQTDEQLFQEAVKDTQSMMTDPSARVKLLKQDASAQGANQQVESLTGGNGDHTNEIYALAAEVLGSKSKGNANTMQLQNELGKAQGDPDRFAASWTPEQKAKLKALAEKIEAGKNKKP